MVFVYLLVVTTSIVDTLQGLSKPLESDISTTHAGQFTIGCINGLYESTIMTTNIGSIIVIIRLRPETGLDILGMLVPARLGVVMTGRTYHTNFEIRAIRMVYIGLEPLTLTGEEIRFECSKITTHIGIQVRLLFEGLYYRLGAIHVFLNLIKHIDCTHLHTPDGFIKLCSYYTLQACITYISLCAHSRAKCPIRYTYNHQYNY